MHLFLRQGSVSRDLERLLPLVRPSHMPHLSLCTDDLSSRDLYESGHLDRLVSRLVQSKVPLFRALRLVTGNPAVYFNLSDRNALAPGRKADLVVFDNPAEMRVRATVKDGKVVYREGEAIGAQKEARPAPASPGSMWRLSARKTCARRQRGEAWRDRRPRGHDYHGRSGLRSTDGRRLSRCRP